MILMNMSPPSSGSKYKANNKIERNRRQAELLISCMAYYSALKMGVMCSPETSVSLQLQSLAVLITVRITAAADIGVAGSSPFRFKAVRQLSASLCSNLEGSVELRPFSLPLSLRQISRPTLRDTIMVPTQKFAQPPCCYFDGTMFVHCLLEIRELAQNCEKRRRGTHRQESNCVVLFQRRGGISVDRTDQDAMFIQMVGEYTASV
jgi:hypothetical protein